MKPVMTRGLNEDEIKALKSSFNESEVFRERLSKVLKGSAALTEKKQRELSYDKPAWAEFQADCNGYLRAINEVIEILDPQE